MARYWITDEGGGGHWEYNKPAFRPVVKHEAGVTTIESNPDEVVTVFAETARVDPNEYGRGMSSGAASVRKRLVRRRTKRRPIYDGKPSQPPKPPPPTLMPIQPPAQSSPSVTSPASEDEDAGGFGPFSGDWIDYVPFIERDESGGVQGDFVPGEPDWVDAVPFIDRGDEGGIEVDVLPGDMGFADIGGGMTKMVLPVMMMAMMSNMFNGRK